jgi:hypothetical protein
MVASAIAFPLLGSCGDPTGVDDVIDVTGYVLEYTDATRTTTVPVVDAMLELILPDGETREECVGWLTVDCYDVAWVDKSWTNMDDSGRYLFRITDPEHCALRVRAYGGHVNGVPITTGKTATAPRLAAVCEYGNQQEGPTLIIE